MLVLFNIYFCLVFACNLGSFASGTGVIRTALVLSSVIRSPEVAWSAESVKMNLASKRPGSPIAVP